MKSGAIAEKLSVKISVSKKSARNIVELIAGSLARLAVANKNVTIKNVGSVTRVHKRMFIEEKQDGSFKVHPPSMNVSFTNYAGDNSADALRTSQEVISMIMSSDNIAYEQIKNAYSVFCKIIRKALQNGKTVKITGLGIFCQLPQSSTDEEQLIEYIPSENLLKVLNDPFESLKEKVTFPIPPLILSGGKAEVKNAGSSDDDLSDSPVKKKLAMMSGDLIRLNEEINKKKPKSSGRGLWG